MKVRLDRWLSMLGVCSRSEGKDLIRRGAVRVNGQAILDPGAAVETEAAGERAVQQSAARRMSVTDTVYRFAQNGLRRTLN